MEIFENDMDDGSLVTDVEGDDADLWAQPLIEHWIMGEESVMPDVEGDDADLWAQPLIEYWIWNGTRLIPASANQADRLREIEAMRRLEQWKYQQERERRKADWRRRWAVLPTGLAALAAAFRRRVASDSARARRKASHAPAEPKLSSKHAL